MSLPIRTNGTDTATSTAPTKEARDMAMTDRPETTNALSPEVLLERCNELLGEIESFRDYIREHRTLQRIELSHYRSVVKAEAKNLEKLTAKRKEAIEQGRASAKASDDEYDSDVSGSVVRMAPASSNLPFLEAVWNSVKSTTGLVALQKRFFYGQDVERVRKQIFTKNGRRRAASATVKTGKALVDIVAKDGLEWIKVSLISNHRMLMDKAREGWAAGESDEDDQSSDEDGTSPSNKDDDPDASIPLVKMCDALLQAADEVAIRTQHPVIRLLLPKIVEHQIPEIDKILLRLRTSGIQVETDGQATTFRPLAPVLPSLVTDPFASFTSRLNIDCTILLGLVSDFSHTDVSNEPWFHKALKRQIEIEEQQNLLPGLLYPAIQGRRLMCTREAARRMREIVATIGTPGEKARTDIVMGQADTNGILSDTDGHTTADMASNEDESRRRVALLQEQSRFPVPDDLILPIHIMERADSRATTSNGDTATIPYGSSNNDTAPVPEHQATKGLPPVAARVAEALSDINRSVFLYGWAESVTTITSNRTVVKQIDGILDAHARDGTDWPRIWLCPTARSLVGKEKGRRE